MSVLRDDEDAFGRLLLDHVAGIAGEAVLERDDGHTRAALPAGVFFAGVGSWPAAEREVFGQVRGRVLDIGCGAGRHSLEAQRRGHDVVAIDVSPGAVEVSRRRGVRDVRLLALADVDAGPDGIDTVLMLCGNFGLFGSPEGARRLLGVLHRSTSASGRIVFDTVDPYVTTDPRNLEYHRRNRERGRLPGHVTLRLRYGPRVTPWFDLLNVSRAELEQLVHGTGWRISSVLEGDGASYFGVLEKVRPG